MKEPFIFLCPEVTRENAFDLMRWLKDENVRQYLSDTHHASRDIAQVVERVNLPILTHIFNRNCRFFMVCDKKNVPVGFVRLIPKGDETEIVVVIGCRENWGKRMGTAAIRESLKIAFFEMRAKKVVAKIYQKNLRSIRAFAHTGFRLKGHSGSIKHYVLTMEEYLQRSARRSTSLQELYITEIDKQRLDKFISDHPQLEEKETKAVSALRREIEKARVVSPKQLSPNVITMNSKALLHLDGEELAVSLVYPDDASINSQKLSVLSPIGTAIFGYSEGADIRWEVPSGLASIHIKEILYQPEAAGDYHL